MSAPSTAERVRIPRAAGTLAGALHYPDAETRGAALVVSPHPLMGGRAEAPLLHAISQSLAQHSIVSMRFDFSGVGESDGDRVDVESAMTEFWATGRTGKDARFVDDALAAACWLADECGCAPWLVGHSFGGWVTTKIATQHTPGVVMIAPPFGKHSYAEFASLITPALAVIAARDFAHDQVQLDGLVGRRVAPTRVVSLETDHFFRGDEAGVAETVARFINEGAHP
jgi:alpha/beta superfamily hydrolase